MSTAVVKAVGLTKVFRDFWRRARVKAVSDVDLEIDSGEIYGLLGPNGSGKSTTIKMLLGLLYPTRGRITVFGRPADDVRIKNRIGYLPEESYLYRFLNARETLDYYATLFQIERPVRKRRIEELLEMVGLRSAARRPVGEYSKGMARRIGLAQALINDPDFLILDEPTSGLDPVGSKLVKDIIVRLGRHFKKTILLSSHLLADVEEVCSRVTILYGGRIQESGTIEQVLARQDQVQLTTGRLSPQTLAQIQQLVEGEGHHLDISVPRDRLEALFLRIVQQAQQKRIETHGSDAAGAIAGFLGGAETGAGVIEELLKTEPVAETTAVAAPAPAAPAEPAADVLAALTTPKADQEAAQPAAPRPSGAPAAAPRPRGAAEAVDQNVLDELLGDSQEQSKS